MTARRLVHAVSPAVLVLAAGALSAQLERPFEQRIVAAASMPDRSTEIVRVDSLIADMTRTGELVLVTSQPDRRPPIRRIDAPGSIWRRPWPTSRPWGS